MNPIPTLEKEAESVEDLIPVSPVPKSNPKPAAESPVKKWVKSNPFFPVIDYFRRKIYDSPLFDGSVRPLAKKLEEWPGALLIDITNRSMHHGFID